MNIKLKCIEVLDGEEFTRGKSYEVCSVRHIEDSVRLIVKNDIGDLVYIVLRRRLNWQSGAWQSIFRIQLIPVVRDSVQ